MFANGSSAAKAGKVAVLNTGRAKELGQQMTTLKRNSETASSVDLSRFVVVQFQIPFKYKWTRLPIAVVLDPTLFVSK